MCCTSCPFTLVSCASCGHCRARASFKKEGGQPLRDPSRRQSLQFQNLRSKPAWMFFACLIGGGRQSPDATEAGHLLLSYCGPRIPRPVQEGLRSSRILSQPQGGGRLVVGGQHRPRQPYLECQRMIGLLSARRRCGGAAAGAQHPAPSWSGGNGRNGGILAIIGGAACRLSSNRLLQVVPLRQR